MSSWHRVEAMKRGARCAVSHEWKPSTGILKDSDLCYPDGYPVVLLNRLLTVRFLEADVAAGKEKAPPH